MKVCRSVRIAFLLLVAFLLPTEKLIASPGAVPPGACLYALDTTADRAFQIAGAQSVYTACGAVVESNASDGFEMEGSETLYLQNHAQVSVVGGAQLNGETLWDTISNKQVQAVQVSSPGDPLASIAPPTTGTIVGKTPTYFDMNSKPAKNTISPGVYCGGLKIGNTNGTAFTFSPGVYILAGGGLTLESQADVTGSGVTFYNTSSAGWGCSSSYNYTPVTISGQVTATFSAPASGSFNGILFFGNRTGCSTKGSCTDQINGGSTAILNGALYFASDEIMITGSNASGYMMLVADKIYINGNSNFGSNGNPFDGISVSVAPSTATLFASQTQQFTATVNNSANPAVTWTISPTGAGSISSSGAYTAPASITAQQTVTVAAASQADNTKSGTAIITLAAAQTTPTITWATPAAITYGTALSATQLDATANVAGTFIYSPVAGTVLAAGSQTLSVTFTPTNTTAYNSATAHVTLTVNAAAPVITWSAPVAMTYGTALSATQLDATASVPGTFVYSPAAGTVIAAGAQVLSVTFTPTNTTDYTSATATVALTVNKATPVITWNTPGATTYGTALSAIELDATASVAGTFAYSPAAGTVLAAGSQTLSVTFTPTNATDYGSATANVALTVNKATPVITWAAPAAIPYGTALSTAQLDATANVPGTFAYAPASGTLLTAGSQTLSTIFTPTDTADYSTGTASVALMVNKATPVIAWSAPAAITYGTALSVTQLDAMANVAGTFAYTPASGTVLPAGSQTLSVTFTPTDTTDYNTAPAGVTLTVNAATPAITWATPAAITYGTALSGTQLDASANVGGSFAYSPAAGTVLPAGSQTLSVTFTPTDAADYGMAAASVVLTISPPVAVTVAPSSATLGAGQTQQFTATVSNTINMAVTWTISPVGAGSISATGLYTAPATISTQQTVMVTATSVADTTQSASATVSLTSPQCGSNGYSFGRAIVIDHSQVPNTDQVNFPFLFNTTDPTLATTTNGGHVTSPSGYDIIFASDPAGQNTLNYEMEEYDPVHGQVIAWVRIPTLSHATDTVIYVFYGNSSITTSQQNAAGVWDANYMGVWHVASNGGEPSLSYSASNVNKATRNGLRAALSDSASNGNSGTNDGPQLSLSDSTSYGNNATNNGATATTGQIDGGMQTNGSTYAAIGTPANLASLEQGNTTFSAWVNTAAGAGGMIMGNEGANANAGWGLGLDANNNVDFESLYSDGSLELTGSGPAASGTWSYVTVTLAGAASAGGSQATLYINGQLSSTGSGGGGGGVDVDIDAHPRTANLETDSVTSSDFTQPAYLANGAFSNGSVSSPLNGASDEFRISNVIRSADWIASEYNNQSSPSTFYTLYPENIDGVIPATETLYASQSEQFAAITVCSIPPVTWSIPSGAPGTLTSGGLYTAPASIDTQQTLTVTATSQTDGSTVGTATVTLMPPLTVSVSPSTPTLYASNESLQFTASFTNATNTGVTWSVTPNGMGTISAAGLYTAPYFYTQQTVTIIATSQVDPTQSASATLTLLPVTITPNYTSPFGGFSVQYSANVPVIWSLSPSSAGIIDATGLFTPAINLNSAQFVTVTATVLADPNASATAYSNVNPPFSLFPLTTTLTDGQTQYFSACAATAPNSIGCSGYTASWSINPGGPGSIDSSGGYTAPAAITSRQTAVITATDIANPLLTLSATITLVPPVASVLPASTTLYAGQTQQYSACLATAPNAACAPMAASWSISPASAGSINSSGLYSTPVAIPSQQTVVITATDQANPLVTASATLNLIPPVVNVSPSVATLYGGQSEQFFTQVADSVNTAVNWSITPAGAGSISSSGLYTSPIGITSQQTVTVTATSQAGPGVPGTAVITLSPTQCATKAYSYVRSIAIDHTKVPNTDQTNFPFLFSATDPAFASVANGGHITSSTGNDIYFSSDTAGANRLDYELEEYNPVSGQMLAWIRIPTLTHASDTVIYMFYGNASATAPQQNPGGVWDNNYQSVYHLSNVASGVAIDSTGFRNNVPAIGLTSPPGDFDTAAGFNGTGSNGIGSYLELPSSDFASYPSNGQYSTTFAASFGVWFKTSSEGVILGQVGGTTTPGQGPDGWTPALYVDDTGSLRGSFFDLQDSTETISIGGNGISYSGAPQLATTRAYNDNQWHFAAITYGNNGVETLYVDGQTIGSNQNTVEQGYSSPYSYFVGAGFDNGWPGVSEGAQWEYFNGALEEVEVSSIARSGDWLQTEYFNQRSPATFFALSPEVSGGVSINPLSSSLYAGQSQQFTVIDQAMCGAGGATWFLPAGSPGVLSAGGLYTAPSNIPAQQTVAITATTLGNAVAPVTAMVTLLPPVTIGVTPSSISVPAGQPQQFTAAVTNTSNTAVYWSISPASAGTISSSGLYIAPVNSAVQTIVVTATSLADTTQSASATVTLIPAVSGTLSLTPLSAILYGGQSQQFTAGLGNTSNAAVTWTIDPAGVGNVSATGLYTAPATVATQQTVTITATSTDDSTESASAAITLVTSQCASNGYGYERVIVIDHTKVANSDQTDFPFMFSAIDPDLASASYGGHVTSSSGYDIFFSTDPNGQTKLDHEVEEYNPATGQVIAWIRIPRLSHTTDTLVYEFYGNANIISPQQNPAGVWNSNYLAVYHMANVANGTATDSTAFANVGTTTDVSQASGLIDGAGSFDGATSFLQIPNADFPSYPTGQYNDLGLSGTAATSTPFAASVGMWFKTTSPGGLLSQVPGISCTSYVFFWCIGTGPTEPGYNDPAGWSPMLYVDDNGNLVGAGVTTSTIYTDNQWHYAVVTYANNGTNSLYVDGQQQGASLQNFPVGYSLTYNYFVGTAETLLAYEGNWNWLYFNGTIDEVSVTDTAVSSDWIQTQYNNQASPATFYQYTTVSNTRVVPAAINLYASQTEQFAVPGVCNSSLDWSIPAGATGSLSATGFYTAPSAISSQQTVTITATSQATGTPVATATVTLLSPPQAVTLVADGQQPYPTGTTQSLTATLLDQQGNPQVGVTVAFVVTGANSGSGSSTTNKYGLATYSFNGTNSGSDTVQATASIDGQILSSNSVSVSWVVPVAPPPVAGVTLMPPPTLGVIGLMGAFTDNTGAVIEPIAIGASPGEFVVPAGATQLQLGVNSDYYPGDGGPGFNVAVNGSLIAVPPTAMPWIWTAGGLNTNYQYGIYNPGIQNGVLDGTPPVVVPINLTAGEVVSIAYQGGLASANLPVRPLVNANGDPTWTPGVAIWEGTYFPTLYTTTTSYPLGQPISFSALVTNATGAPVPNVPVTLNISGGNVQQLQATTDSTGTAVFLYTGAYTGTDSLQAEAYPPGGSAYTSELSTVTWVNSAYSPFGGSLALNLFGFVNDVQAYVALSTDAQSNPISNVNLGFYVWGVDNFSASGTTDTTGHAGFSYTHTDSGSFNLVAVETVNGNEIYSSVIPGYWTMPTSTTNCSSCNSITVGISAQTTVTLPTTLTLTGTVTDNVGITPTVSWTQLSGPGIVTFATPQQAVTTASFSQPGVYVIQLYATDTGVSATAQFQVTVNPPAVTGTPQGWVASPLYGSTVTGFVPIKLATGTTLESGTLTICPTSNTDNVTVLNGNGNTSGQIATLDTTTLPNGSYWIQLQGTDTNGNSQNSLIMVTVAGNYKPGRVTSTVTDLVVPATGLPISIQRTYDSLNAGTSGDFGYGWNLGINVNLVVDNAGNVTFTLGGQRRTFYLTPQAPPCVALLGCLFPYYYVAYTPEPGFYGTLTSYDLSCPAGIVVPDGNLWSCQGGGQYNPPSYTYTDANGTSYIISSSGQLQSIVDRSGNGLSITPNGITSTTGLNVPFVRDSQNRITQITDPQGNIYQYGYDDNGNLASVTYPSITTPSTYTYAANHYYLSGTDFRGYNLPSTAYYDDTTDGGNSALDGRLLSITDAFNNTTSYAYTLSTTSIINGVSVPNTGVTTITYPPDANNKIGTATMIYDSYGMLLSSTDQLGHTTINAYDANHNLISVTDPLGHTTSYTYDANGNRTSQTYPATATSTNTTTHATYGLNGAPLTYTDEDGNIRNFSYDANGNLAGVTDTINGKTANVVSSIYSANGLLQAVSAGADLTKTPSAASTFTYDANGNLASATNPLGKTTSYTYDALGRVISLVRSPGASSTSSGESASHVSPMASNNIPNIAPGMPARATASTRPSTGLFASRQTAHPSALPRTLPQDSISPPSPSGCSPGVPEVFSATYTYSAMYGTSSEVDSLGRTAGALYDGNGNLITYTDADGYTYQYTYDALNRLTNVTLPTQPATGYSFTYDSANHVIDAIDPEGHDRHNVYDLAGRLTSVTIGNGTPAATTTNFSYNDDGTLHSVTDALNHTTTYGYDAAGNLTQVVRGDVSVQYAYDNARNRISSTDGNGNVTNFQYDARQRLQQIGFADKTQQTINYNNDGTVASVVDQAGHTIDYGYEGAGNLISVTQANSPYTSANTVTYCRDGLGNLAWEADENGHFTSQMSDPIGRPTSLTFPDGVNGLTASYDGNSNLITLGKTSTGGSKTATFGYDSLNRLVSETPDAAYGEPAINFTYTANGLLSKMTDGSGTTSYTYDSLDRVISKTTSAGTLTYTYDAVGNVASVSSGGVSVGYTYDDLNRLSTVTDNNLGGTTTYTYDPASNLATAHYPNGLNAVFSYDQLNRLSQASTAVAGYQYQRDANGNILTATEANNRATIYSYDGLDQLTSETVANDPTQVDGGVSYSLDPVGNRQSDQSTLGPIIPTSATYNAVDQSQTDSYDTSGDTTFTGGNSYAYNSWLRLVSMNGGQVTLTYNGLGQLVSKTANGATTQYLVDDLSPTGYPQVVEELVNGQVTRQYTYGLERISEDQVVQGAWTASFYQYDGRGTVRMLTSAAGAITDTYEYDAFGNEISHTGTTPNNYLYRGEQWDPDLGLYYLRARWYNPATGRFMTRDPYSGSIYDPASLHRYNYARANPVNFIDPSGRASASDYALLGANALASGASVYAFGRAVDCALFAEASAMDLVGETIDRQLDQFKLLFQGCEAQITVSQFVTGTLANTALGLGFGAAGWAFRSIGGLLEGAEQGFWFRLLTEEEGGIGPTQRIVAGSTSGGPGVWGLSPKFPTGAPGLYQKFVTGAPAGFEYGVATDLQPSGWNWFDGYSSDTGNFLDAKYLQGWPNPDFPPSFDSMAEDLAQEARIAASFGRSLEVVVPSQQYADILEEIIEDSGISNIIVKVKGW